MCSVGPSVGPRGQIFSLTRQTHSNAHRSAEPKNFGPLVNFNCDNGLNTLYLLHTPSFYSVGLLFLQLLGKMMKSNFSQVCFIMEVYNLHRFINECKKKGILSSTTRTRSLRSSNNPTNSECLRKTNFEFYILNVYCRYVWSLCLRSSGIRTF